MKKVLLGLALLAPALFVALAADGPAIPLGLLPVRFPKENPYTAEKAELGKLLYYDKRLSADGTVSCATCHSPKFAYTDGKAVSDGIKGQRGGRSAPTVINRAYSLAQFWDGRAKSLEEQSIGPMANPIEMGNTHESVVKTLKGVEGYRKLFAKVFGTENFDINHVAMAIATFERTVLSGNSPYDRYKAGDRKQLSAAAVRGMNVYLNKAKCDQCHEGINFTTNAYHNLGVGTDKPTPDEGRFAVTKNAADWGAFKTPTLRDIARTAPYMHDGSLKTLEEVVDFYDKGGLPNKNLDERMKKLNLTAQDKTDLVEFMKSLNGEGWQSITEPKSFPQ
ncbi:MAG: c-type cytochrome [Acidobacteria bacterium]|nr:c-type cytochrome [Acidobacteriota bacterium]